MLLRFVSSPHFYLRTNFRFCGEIRRRFPFILFGAIEREVGKESRQFLVDILTLVAVALGQEFLVKKGA